VLDLVEKQESVAWMLHVPDDFAGGPGSPGRDRRRQLNG